MKRIFKSILTFLIVLFLPITIGLGSFIVVNTFIQNDITYNKSEEIGKICHTFSDNKHYSTLKEAVDVANSRGNEKVIVNYGATAIVDENIVIKNGVSLIVPFGETIDAYAFTKNKYTISSVLKLTKGADLTIESGAELIVGGEIQTTGISGKYAQLILDSDSSILVNGKAFIYGKVMENNPIYGYNNPNNITYDNTLDSQRFLKIASTGYLETAFASYDMGSGSAIMSKIENNICPTYKFDFPCLGTYTSIEAGGIVNVMAYLSVAGQTKNVLCGLVGSSSSTQKQRSLFYNDKGEISFEYTNNNKTLIYINGDVKMGTLYIDPNIGNVVIDSKNFVLPISSKFNISLNGTFNTNNQSIKFLPGSELRIENNAKLFVDGTVNDKSELFFYRADTFLSLNISGYGNLDSKFVNNGSVSINEHGEIGGYCDTESTNGNSIIDLSKVTDNKKLKISTKEGTSGELTITPLEFKGPFYDTNSSSGKVDNPFQIGQVYHSHNGHASYDGNVQQMYNININVNKTNYLHDGFKYNIYTNTSPSDSNASKLFESDQETLKTYSMEAIKGTYIKLTDDKCEWVTLNGEPYVLNTWLEVNSNIEFKIQPISAHNIKCWHGEGSSGAGRIHRSIKYGSDENNLIYMDEKKDGGIVEVNIPDGWKFMVSDNSNFTSGGTSTVTKITVDSNGKLVREVILSASRKLAWNEKTIFTADADYEFFNNKVNCLVEGTKIQMANGTIKLIENLKAGDKVKVFNHFTGKLDESVVAVNVHENSEATNSQIINLVFDDGITTRMSFEHGYFDIELNEYVYINMSNYKEHIGRSFASFDSFGNKKVVKLIDAYITVEKVKVFSPVTYKHLNIISDDLLSIGGDIRGLFNYFTLDKDMKVIKELMEQDIMYYGLYEYNEWKDKLTPIEFDAFNVKYLKISVGKGLVTLDEIYRYIDSYLR